MDIFYNNFKMTIANYLKVAIRQLTRIKPSYNLKKQKILPKK